MDSYDDIIKICVVGDSGNGKTSLIQRFANGEFFEEATSTLGIDYSFKIIKIDVNVNVNANIKDNNLETPLLNNNIQKRIKLKIWDTAGQEKFGDIIRSCYRDSDGVIITYDTTKLESFENLEKWIEKIKKVVNPDNITIMIAGTKTDLVEHRMVPENKIFDFVHKNKFKYIEVSAKDSKNIDVLFNMMVTSILGSGKVRNLDKNKFTQKISLIQPKKEIKENNNFFYSFYC